MNREETKKAIAVMQHSESDHNEIVAETLSKVAEALEAGLEEGDEIAHLQDDDE